MQPREQPAAPIKGADELLERLDLVLVRGELLDDHLLHLRVALKRGGQVARVRAVHRGAAGAAWRRGWQGRGLCGRAARRLRRLRRLRGLWPALVPLDLVEQRRLHILDVRCDL